MSLVTHDPRSVRLKIGMYLVFSGRCLYYWVGISQWSLSDKDFGQYRVVIGGAVWKRYVRDVMSKSAGVRAGGACGVTQARLSRYRLTPC